MNGLPSPAPFPWKAVWITYPEERPKSDSVVPGSCQKITCERERRKGPVLCYPLTVDARVLVEFWGEKASLRVHAK